MGGGEEQFSLKWNDFYANLSEGFNDLLEGKTMVDVTLGADGKFVQAHKLVLSVCSSYFRDLFEVNPCKHPIVILKDVEHTDLLSMLQFMYKGEVGVRHHNLPSFLKLAHTLRVKGLTDERIKIMKSNSCNRSPTIKVRKDKHHSIECNKENTDSSYHSDSTRHEKTRIKKRRVLEKSEAVRKVKRTKCDDKSYDSDCSAAVSVGYSVSGDCDSGDAITQTKDSDLLGEFVDDSVTCDQGVKSSELNSESRIDCGASYTEGNLDGNDSDDLDGADELEASTNVYNADNTIESEQAPQDVDHRRPFEHFSVPRRTKNVRTSLIWKYFIKYPASATCRLCGRTFKGFRPHTSIECHLKTRHYGQYLDFMKNREEQRKQLAKTQFGDLFSRLYGMNNFNY